MPHLSVVIPAYNEENRLLQTLQSIHDYLTQSGNSFEIVVVDDGSTDHTIEVVQDFASHHDFVRLISYAPNQGKGYAVRTGMLAANGDFLLLDDADGSSPIEEVERLQAAITSSADIAIGSRNIITKETKIDAIKIRTHLGNTFNMVVQSLLLPGIQDTQCGFKLFKHSVAQDLFSVTTQNGFAFDVEVLFVAKLRGYKIAEIAINWHHVSGSKVNLVADATNMLLQVISIRFGAWTGRYRQLTRKK